MMKSVLKKIRNSRALTLTEILITLLIASLVASAVAAGVSSSLKVYKKSVALSDAQTVLSTLSQAVMDELRFASDISLSDGTVSFTSKNYGGGCSFFVSGDGYIMINGKQLLPQNSYVGCKANISVDYNGDIFDVEIIVFNEEIECDAQFSVRPLQS